MIAILSLFILAVGLLGLAVGFGLLKSTFSLVLLHS